MKINIRLWLRIIHRDLSFLFSGLILVYAISGLVLNHRDSINPDFILTQKEYRISGAPLTKEQISDSFLTRLLQEQGIESMPLKTFYPKADMAKVLLKDKSTLAINMQSGEIVHESIRKRPFFSQINWLHYNPKGWVVFADSLAISLIIITLTGIFMNRGKNGLRGRGGIELLIGILAPLVFILLYK